MIINVLTLFPDFINSLTNWSIIGRAYQKGLYTLNVINLRDFTEDKHNTADDYPYGGGAGMIMKPEPIFRAVSSLPDEETEETLEVILLSPQGEIYNQQLAKELAKKKSLTLLCGHYKAIDERVRIGLNIREISIGDYVLSGGELASMVLIDSVVRLLPEALSNFDSAESDSFYNDLLDAPYYTRPEEYKGMKVPKILLSGHHAQIKRWRRKEALRNTLLKRPDLLNKISLTEEDHKLLEEIREE